MENTPKIPLHWVKREIHKTAKSFLEVYTCKRTNLLSSSLEGRNPCKRMNRKTHFQHSHKKDRGRNFHEETGFNQSMFAFLGNQKKGYLQDETLHFAKIQNIDTIRQ